MTGMNTMTTKLLCRVTASALLLAAAITVSLERVAVGDDEVIVDDHAHTDGGSHSEGGHGGEGQGQGGQGQGGHGEGGKGQGGHDAGSSSIDDVLGADEHDHSDSEESDRPEWAGGGGKPGTGKPDLAGIQKGDIFGDMYVLLRDANGVPILSAAGFVQPVDAAGNPLPLDDEGHVLPDYADETVEVELSRLNVSRAPSHVLDRRLTEALATIDSATAVTTDAAGRLVLTIDGEERTIDAPLENLAIYLALVNYGTIGTSLSDETLGDLAFLNDGQITSQDYAAAASFLAGAADKFGDINVDSVVYLNSILGLDGTITAPDGSSYVDYSGFAYDRSDAYAEVTVTILVEQPDGSWAPETVNVYDAVFGGEDFASSGGAVGYAQAVDDAVEVIQYIHEYQIPVEDLGG